MNDTRADEASPETPAESRYASRKFLLAALVVAAATLLCSLGMLDGGQWVTAAVGTVTVYNAANVGQKLAPGASSQP